MYPFPMLASQSLIGLRRLQAFSSGLAHGKTQRKVAYFEQVLALLIMVRAV
jgi:hypothetical protein